VEGVLTLTRDVFVVDDGSIDTTFSKIKSLGIPVIQQPHKGKGAALIRGFGYALKNSNDWVITMDGDGQHDWRISLNFLLPWLMMREILLLALVWIIPLPCQYLDC